MAFPFATYTNANAAGALFNAAASAGLDLSGLAPIAGLQSAVANLLVSDPSTVNVPSGDVLAGTFGANKAGGADTGTYTFPGALVWTTSASSLTALATPSAYVATTGALFASTVSGATLMGFGTTGDVTLKNRAGTDVIVVTANTTGVTMAGALAMTGALSGVTTAVLSSTISFTGGTFTTSLSSVTALATPGAYAATTGTVFASTVSGASLMGFGTTNDVALMNRAGTVVLGIGPNTTAVNMAGALAITGALSGVTSTTFSTNEISTTALATPGAIAATQYTAFASTVSGATLMGFGTTGDVTLKNRAGTDVLVVTSNTTGVTLAGALAVSGIATFSVPFTTSIAQAGSVGTTPGTPGTDFTFVSGQGGPTTIVTTGIGGKGGGWTYTTGAGGTAALAATAGTGGAGGDYAVTTGAGAASVVTGAGTGTGGKGGALAFLSGVGGLTSTSTGVNLGGASGAISLTTASGGASTNGSSNTGGASGAITITTGSGGTGATAAGASGAVTISTGAQVGSAGVGSVVLSPGTLALVTASWTSSTVGLVTIGGTYGAGVASMRYNGLTTASVNNQAGTLTNAPVVGNPAFWMPISIAGTIRYVPCW